jgi:DNA transformation protein
MATIPSDFADYCCELLSPIGPCRAKRMFGGWGIAIDGMTIAILANLGQGDTLWLKADVQSQALFEAEGCARFTYEADGKIRGMSYYSAPADAMESPALMQPWARLALHAAVAAHANKKPAVKKTAVKKAGVAKSSAAKPAKPPRSR